MLNAILGIISLEQPNGKVVIFFHSASVRLVSFYIIRLVPALSFILFLLRFKRVLKLL